MDHRQTLINTVTKYINEASNEEVARMLPFLGHVDGFVENEAVVPVFDLSRIYGDQSWATDQDDIDSVLQLQTEITEFSDRNPEWSGHLGQYLADIRDWLRRESPIS